MTPGADVTSMPDLPLESQGRHRATDGWPGAGVVVVGAGQTDFHPADQPIGNGWAISVLLAR